MISRIGGLMLYILLRVSLSSVNAKASSSCERKSTQQIRLREAHVELQRQRCADHHSDESRSSHLRRPLVLAVGHRAQDVDPQHRRVEYLAGIRHLLRSLFGSDQLNARGIRLQTGDEISAQLLLV
jgi:hypothetical protein